jgi:hypothetical protein
MIEQPIRRIAGPALATMGMAAMLVATVALADVNSKQVVLSARSGRDFFVPMTVMGTAGEQIAGINGQMNFDPALFSAPELQVGPGALGFIGLGNESAPGKFRFVLYADPTQLVGQLTPVLYVKLTASGSLPADGQSTITFLNGPIGSGDPDKAGESAASSAEGVSLAGVQFSEIVVALDQSAAGDWLLYE